MIRLLLISGAFILTEILADDANTENHRELFNKNDDMRMKDGRYDSMTTNYIF